MKYTDFTVAVLILMHHFQTTVKQRREYVEECYKEIMKQKDVLAVVVIGKNGHPIKSTLDDATSLQYAGLFGQLIDKTRSAIQSLDADDEMTFIRIRSRKHEVIVTPDEHAIFLVMQNPLTNI